MRNDNKPSWDDAPEWANWLAMDETGEWVFFENKPMPVQRRNGKSFWCTKNGGAVKTARCQYWDKTLESREDAKQ